MVVAPVGEQDDRGGRDRVVARRRGRVRVAAVRDVMGAETGYVPQTARLLAGFDDTRPGAVSASGAGGAPTMAGLQAVREAES